MDHVVPEIRSKYKGISTPIANKEIITGSACQRVAAGRAQGSHLPELATTWLVLSSSCAVSYAAVFDTADGDVKLQVPSAAWSPSPDVGAIENLDVALSVGGAFQGDDARRALGKVGKSDRRSAEQLAARGDTGITPVAVQILVANFVSSDSSAALLPDTAPIALET